MSDFPAGNFASQADLDRAIANWRRHTPLHKGTAGVLIAERDAVPSLKGHWILNVFDGDIERDAYGLVRNRLVDQLDGYNLVTTNGKGTILDRLYGLGGIGAVTKMGVGTDNTAAAVGNSSLTAVDYGPAAFDSTPTRSSLVVTSLQTWSTSQGNITWAELGSFTAANVLLNRIAPIGPYTKTSANAIIASLALTQA